MAGGGRRNGPISTSRPIWSANIKLAEIFEIGTNDRVGMQRQSLSGERCKQSGRDALGRSKS